MDGTVHKAGPLRQQNKPFKSGRHASKGMLKRKTKGKVSQNAHRANVKSVAPNTRNQRKQISQLNRTKLKDEVLFSKRLGTNAGPPKIVGLVALGEGVNLHEARTLLINGLVPDVDKAGPLTVVFPMQKQRMTLMEVPRDQEAVLDVAKAADIILFVVDAALGVDDLGITFISLIKAQGLPSVLVTVQGLPKLPPKAQAEAKKRLKEFVRFHFPDHDRLQKFDTPEDAGQVLRFLSTIRIKQLGWRERRAYMLVESLTFTPNPSPATSQESGAGVGRGTLQVSGYLRGANLSANDLIHIPDFGDFQIGQIDGPVDPHPFNRRGKEGPSGGMDIAQDPQQQTASTVLDVPNPELQESLQSEMEPDVLGNEQNWGPEDDAELALAEQRKKRLVPKGTSAYQAAWIIDESDGEDDGAEYDDGENDGDDAHAAEDMTRSDDEDGEEDEEENEEGGKKRKGKEIANMDEGGEAKGQQDSEGEPEEYEELKEDDETETNAHESDEEEVDMDAAQKERERLRQESEEDVKWPDEVQTPLNVKAKIRFRKYRGLKSFRNTPWDPKENLPLDYARIFQFKNFSRTVKRIFEDRSSYSGVIAGTYVTIHILDVPQTLSGFVHISRPFVVSGLLKHEHKTSVLHFTAQRIPAYEDPIRSKDDLIIQCGFRRFRGRPFFSQNTSNDKHKMERFLQAGNAAVASIYGPITIPPAPVLYFKDLDRRPAVKPVHRLQLVAIGSLLAVDPDRVAVKKIVLTGFPYKLHKRTAVVKHMFYYPDDIRWFKSVELWTKYGRTGHITEPLGTHGLMKCRFDGKLLSHDTVCMNLYKRVYPKWDTTTLLSELPPERHSKRRTAEEENTAPSASVGPALTAEALAALQSLLPQ
jgi:pre-rRNA-processing protein TSR1